MSDASPRKVLFVHLMGFLESMMDFGVKFEDAIKEFLDNAVDSGAENIWILFQKIHKEGGLRVLIADDGCGIPLKFIDENNEECDGIPWVMAFGNRGISTVIADGNKKLIGKFGLGLSTSIARLARKDGNAWIWSRRKEDEEWRSCFFDFKDIESYRHPDTEDNGYLPNERTDVQPPIFPFGDKGTILVIDIPKERQERYRLGSMQNFVLKFAGQTYRHHLADGLTIKVSEDKSGNFSSASHKIATISDPLCLLPDSKEVKKLGFAEEYEVEPIIFDGSNGWPEFKEKNGSYSRIEIRISRIRKHLAEKILFEDVTFAGTVAERGKKRSKILNEYRISQRGQGFSLLREGREITASRSFRLYSKSGYYNYMHGEIDFTTGIDELFTVQANKSRFDISGDLFDLLRETIEPILNKVRDDHNKDVDLGLKLKEEIESNPSDEAIRRVAGRLPMPPNLTDDVIKQANNIRQAKLDAAMEKVKSDINVPLENAKVNLAKAKDRGDEERELIHTSEVAALKERLSQLTEALEKKWNSRQPARIREAPMNHGMVYDVIPEIDEADIVVNTATDFHKLIYNTIRDDKRLKASTDLMLKSLGYAEFIDLQLQPELSGNWEDARREISLRLHQFVDAMPKETVPEEGGEL
jgi:hypothetical protein